MIIEIIVGVVVCSFLYFAFLTWKEKRKLKKLKEEYNENDDKSKRRVAKLEGSKLNTSGAAEFEGRILLPSTAATISGSDTNRDSENELK